MLDLLHIPPVQLELRLNGELWSAQRAQNEFQCAVGEASSPFCFVFLTWRVFFFFAAQRNVSSASTQACHVGVDLLNALDVPLGPLSLVVSAYQDLHNGTCQRRLDTRLLTVGSDSAVLAQVTRTPKKISSSFFFDRSTSSYGLHWVRMAQIGFW